MKFKTTLFLAILLALVVCYSACSGGDDDDDDDDNDDNNNDDDDDDNDDDDTGGDDDDDNDDDTGGDDDDDDDTSPPEEAILIPAGNFQMGCEPEDSWCDDDESPRHEVNLSAYSIYPYEITNEQFAEFLNDHGTDCDGEECGDLDDDDIHITESGGVWSASSGYEDHPIMEVSWYGAAAYCDWAGGRLPTEAEWEKAAKGADEHYIWPFGDDFTSDNAANWHISEDPWEFGDEPKTTPVGYFDGTDHEGTYQTADGRSPYGLHDMAGNVWEWVSDWYDEDYYDSSPSSDPQGPDTGFDHVLRGGGWSNYGENLRTSTRLSYMPELTNYDLGFRCVWD